MRQKPMQKPNAPSGLLIVVELGAEWPSLEETRTPSAARRVLAQNELETPLAFAARVTSQLGELFARGVSLSTAVVACNERLDVSASDARTDIARAALGVMARAQGGTAFLTAPERSSGRLRQGLSSMVAQLGAEWQRSGVRAQVRFGDDAPHSSTTAAAEPMRNDRARKVA